MHGFTVETQSECRVGAEDSLQHTYTLFAVLCATCGLNRGSTIRRAILASGMPEGREAFFLLSGAVVEVPKIAVNRLILIV